MGFSNVAPFFYFEERFKEKFGLLEILLIQIIFVIYCATKSALKFESKINVLILFRNSIVSDNDNTCSGISFMPMILYGGKSKVKVLHTL
jgi:hypothetical protein